MGFTLQPHNLEVKTLPSMKELETWQTTKQVAFALGVSKQGVLDMANQHRVRAVKVGGQTWIYDPKDVKRLADERSKV